MALASPERAFLKKYAEEERRGEILEAEKLTAEERQVYQELVPKMNDARPQFEDFNYPQKRIEKDKELLEREKNRKNIDYRRPRILEANLWYQIEQANWFGENCVTVATSEFDDRVNNTDIVLEFEKKDGSVVRLAIDVTMAGKKEIEAKKDKIIEDIEDGQLTHLRYFQSELEPEVKGRISKIPRVIIGSDTEGIKKLSEMFVKGVKKVKGSQRELAQSEIQIELLEEVRLQLQELTKYATIYFEKIRHSPVGREVVQKHKEILAIVNEILTDKKKKPLAGKPKARKKIFEFITDWTKQKERLVA